MLLCAVGVHAAVLQGTVYDFGLSTVENAVVEVNTTPNQLMVARNGTYRFGIPEGTFTVTAVKDELFIEEAITIREDGEYVLDLILLPELSVEESLMESDEELDLPPLPDGSGMVYWWAGALLLVLGVVGWLFSRKREHLPKDLEKVMGIIRDAGGRIPQKDIYRKVSWSESKVSLMLDDLEARDLIRRVKKGRSKVVFRK